MTSRFGICTYWPPETTSLDYKLFLISKVVSKDRDSPSGMLVNPESLRLGVKMAPTLATSLKVFTSSGSFLFLVVMSVMSFHMFPTR